MQIRRAWSLAPVVLGCALVACSAGARHDDTPAVAPALTPTPPVVPTSPTPAAMPEVSVELASVTLADDCNRGASNDPAPPTAPAAGAMSARAKSSELARSDEGPGASSRGARRCEQTSMQLALVSGKGERAAPIAIKLVELFDTDGTPRGTLTPSAPTTWNGAGYSPWDEQLAPEQTMRVSYVLGAPDWSKIPGRHGKTFRVKVTVTIGDASKTVERQVMSAPSMVDIHIRT